MGIALGIKITIKVLQTQPALELLQYEFGCVVMSLIFYPKPLPVGVTRV
jgi:hypothetical protein